MQTTVFTDEQVFDQLQANWHELAKTQTSPPIFLSPAYQKAWWQALGSKGGSLQIIAAQDNDQLHLVAPLFSEKTTQGKIRLSLIGAHEESDYLDFLISPNHPELYDLLIDQLSKLSWDELWLPCLFHQSPTLTDFVEKVKQKGWQVSQTQQTVCAVITLPKTWDEYLASLSSSQSQIIKKANREIGEDDEISYELVESTDDDTQAVADFIALHKQSGSDKANFWNPERESFMANLAVAMSEAGWLKMYFLNVNGERAAVIWIFDDGNQFFVYNSGFNAFRYGHLKVGNVLMAYTIQEAIKLGRTRYDLMRGDEHYKFNLGAKAEPLFDLLITR